MLLSRQILCIKQIDDFITLSVHSIDYGFVVIISIKYR